MYEFSASPRAFSFFNRIATGKARAHLGYPALHDEEMGIVDIQLDGVEEILDSTAQQPSAAVKYGLKWGYKFRAKFYAP